MSSQPTQFDPQMAAIANQVAQMPAPPTDPDAWMAQQRAAQTPTDPDEWMAQQNKAQSSQPSGQNGPSQSNSTNDIPASKQPGFLARTSERLLGTQHPIDQAVDEAKMLWNDPVGTLTKTVEQPVIGIRDLAYNAVTHPIETYKAVTGASDLQKDVNNKNWRGAAGDLFGTGVNAALAALGGRSHVAPITSTEEASQLALRGGPSLADAAQATEAAAKPAPMPSNIAGVKIPRTASQAGVTPSMTRLEGVFKGVPVVGRPLARIAQRQAALPEEILSKLSGQYEGIEGDTSASSHWNAAAEATRNQASPLYESLKGTNIPEASDAASSILDNPEIQQARALSPKAARALNQLAGRLDDESGLARANEIAKTLTGNDYETVAALAKINPEKYEVPFGHIKQIMGSEGIDVTPSTPFDSAKNARTALLDTANGSSDANVRRLAHQAADMIDASIEKGLTPEQNATWRQANTLWHQSRLQDDFAQALFDSTKNQNGYATRTPSAEAFNRIVNEMSRKTRTGQSSELERMMPSPADRESLKQLGKMLQNGESLQSGSVMLQKLMTVGAITGAAAGHAETSLKTMAAAAMLSKILSSEGGAQAILYALKYGPKTVLGSQALNRLTTIANQSEPPAPQPTSPVPSVLRKAMGGVPTSIAVASGARVRVQHPDGRTGTIPKDQVQDAARQGYVVRGQR